MTMKPILYLDLDETILYKGMPVHNSKAFFFWCTEHFEVRWLTNWIYDGTMNDYQAKVLSKRFNDTISMREFQKYNNPKGHGDSKLDGIDLTTDQPWVWVENVLQGHEWDALKKLNLLHHYYLTDLTLDDPHAIDNAIEKTWRRLDDYLAEQVTP